MSVGNVRVIPLYELASSALLRLQKKRIKTDIRHFAVMRSHNALHMKLVPWVVTFGASRVPTVQCIVIKQMA